MLRIFLILDSCIHFKTRNLLIDIKFGQFLKKDSFSVICGIFFEVYSVFNEHKRMQKTHQNIPKEIFYYGNGDTLPDTKQIRAGDISLEYKEGSLRHINIGHTCILKLVYPAVRDKNWGTVRPMFYDFSCSAKNKSFSMRYKAIFQNSSINFEADFSIVGNDDNSLIFEMTGIAKTDFLKNRIGFNVLHPTAECIGINCLVETAEGESHSKKFPEAISPHQVFRNVRKMTWRPQENIQAKLEFSGDIFETEDQRNWTDDSFKTYSTPLSEPFPVKVKKGQSFRQKIILTVKSDKPLANSEKENRDIFEVKSDGQYFDLPKTGIQKSTEFPSLTAMEIQSLRKLNFNHYRIDIHFNSDNWKQVLESGMKESIELDLKPEIALFFGENSHTELQTFLDLIKDFGLQEAQMLVFDSASFTTTEELTNTIIPKIKDHLNDIAVGGGTDANFAELNRNMPDTDILDFLTYSVTPQVHAFDNESLIDTLSGQHQTVLSLRQAGFEKPVYVSPVTLRPRFNAVATEDSDSDNSGELPENIDSRQMSLFGACWTLGSIKSLAFAGAESVTFFETKGMKGLFSGEDNPANPDNFPVSAGAFYPVFHVFGILNEYGNARVIESVSGNPLKFDGLVQEHEFGYRMILVNYTNRNVNIEIKGIKGDGHIRTMDERTVEKSMYLPIQFIGEDKPFSLNEEQKCIELLPYAIVVVDIDKY